VHRTLADVNADGKFDRREFIIAMFLIKRKLQGYELPTTLPLTLLRSSDSTTTPAPPSLVSHTPLSNTAPVAPPAPVAPAGGASYSSQHVTPLVMMPASGQLLLHTVY